MYIQDEKRLTIYFKWSSLKSRMTLRKVHFHRKIKDKVTINQIRTLLRVDAKVL